jgi:LAS superfamily LD-carboxypeptidase LdcB
MEFKIIQMKTTKLYATLIYVLVFLAISVGSFAQDKDSKVNKTPEEKAKFRTEKLKTSLNLSDDQYSKVYNLNLQRVKDDKEFRESNSKLREDREKRSTEYKSSLNNILTDDQKTAMKKMHKDKKFKKEHKNKRHHRR